MLPPGSEVLGLYGGTHCGTLDSKGTALYPHPGPSGGFSCTIRSRRPPRTQSPQLSLPCLPTPEARPPPCPAFPRSPVSKFPGSLMRNENPGLRPRPRNSLKMGQTLCSWRRAQGSPELPCGDPQPVVSAQTRLPLPPASKLDTLPASPDVCGPRDSLLPRGTTSPQPGPRAWTQAPHLRLPRDCRSPTTSPPVKKGS